MVAENTHSQSLERKQPYNHASLEGRRRFLRFLIKWIGFTLLAKLDHVEGLENVPQEGAALLMINHIAFIDPIVVMHTLPRNIIPLAKVEVYEYPFIGIFPRLWEVIPVKREEFDRHAVQKVMEILKAGEMVLVAPEGTRGPALQQGKEGIAYLATRSNAGDGTPVIPVAITGTIGFPAFRFSSAWRQKGAVIKFGRPFKFRLSERFTPGDSPIGYKPHPHKAGSRELRKMTDEAMYVLARMLPPEQRGVYSDLDKATLDTIEWL